MQVYDSASGGLQHSLDMLFGRVQSAVPDPDRDALFDGLKQQVGNGSTAQRKDQP